MRSFDILIRDAVDIDFNTRATQECLPVEAAENFIRALAAVADIESMRRRTKPGDVLQWLIEEARRRRA